MKGYCGNCTHYEICRYWNHKYDFDHPIAINDTKNCGHYSSGEIKFFGKLENKRTSIASKWSKFYNGLKGEPHEHER